MNSEGGVEAALHRLFNGEKLSYDDNVAITLALHWFPHWPFLDCIAKALRTGKRADWPVEFPDSEKRVAEATAALKPYFEAWKAR